MTALHPAVPLSYPGYIVRALPGANLPRDLLADPNGYNDVLLRVRHSMQAANIGFAWIIFTAVERPKPTQLNFIRAFGMSFTITSTELRVSPPTLTTGYTISLDYETPDGKPYDIVTILPHVGALAIPPALRPFFADFSPLAEAPFYAN